MSDQPPSGRPPTREELAFEWFIGDAKDIMEQMQAILAEVRKLRKQMQQLQEKSVASEATLEQQKIELVEVYRSLDRASKDGLKALETGSQRAVKSAQQSTARTARRLGAVVMLAGCVGSAIGAAAVLAVFMAMGLPSG